MRNPFNVTVYDKNFNTVAYLNDPESLSITPRHLAIGTATLNFGVNHPKLSKVAVEGNRVRITYQGDHLMSGPIRSYRVKGTSKSGIATLGVEDDFRLFFTHLGWIRPDLAIGSQNTGGFKEDKFTGSTEAALKYFLARNAVTRLGRPITIGVNLDRGPTVTVSTRMIPPSDKLIVLAEAANLGMTIRQSGAGFLFDVYQPRVFPHTLSESGGTILEYDFGWDAPTATRTVVGNALEGTLREFVVRSDGAAEALWGDVIEVFTSASDTEVTTEAQARGDATLLEGRSTSGVGVTLSQTKHFAYGGASGFRVGDQVNFRLGGSTFTDILREVTINWTKEEGLRVTPGLGDKVPSPDVRLFRLIRKIQQSVRLQQAR